MLEVTVAEDQQVIETLPSNRAEYPFAVRVRLRGIRWGTDHADPGAFRDSVEERAELPVVVAEEKLRRTTKWSEVSQLLRSNQSIPDVTAMETVPGARNSLPSASTRHPSAPSVAATSPRRFGDTVHRSCASG